MNRLTDFLVKKRNVLLAVLAVLAVAGYILSGHVAKNSDMKKYLPADSDTRKGFELMKRIFPEDDLTGTLKVMIKGLSEDESADFKKRFSDVDGVASVAHDETENYTRDGYSLFVITVDGSPGSKTAAKAYKAAVDICGGRETYFAGEVYLHNIPILPPWVMLLAIGIVTTVLLIMCDSFVSPFLFIACILTAIAINMGSNIIFGEISAITDSVASVLQLALSMDYSIMMMERYRQERAKTGDKDTALKNAISASLLSIAGSAQTTIVGLLTLVFMSFTVGKDLGLVLAKGVLISLLCVFAVLPALIGLADPLIVKAKKRAPNFRTDGFASFIYRAKIPLACVFAAIFIAACFLQGNYKVTYTGAELDHISSVFGNDNPIVLVYKNEYGDGIIPLLDEVEDDPGVRSVISVGTFNKPLKYNEVAGKCASLGAKLPIGDDLVRLIYYRNAFPEETGRMNAGEFARFISDAAKNETFMPIDGEISDRLAVLTRLSDKGSVEKQLTPEETAEMFGTEAEPIRIAFAYAGRKTMSPPEFTGFILGSKGGIIRAALGADMMQSVELLDRYMKNVVSGETLDHKETAALFDGTPLTPALTEAAFVYRASSAAEVVNTLSLKELLSYISDEFIHDGAFAGLIGDGMKDALAEAKDMFASAEKMLVKDEYSRALIRTSYPSEGEATYAFVARTRGLLGDYDECEVYLVGDCTYATEMNDDFGGEYALIAVLTMAAIFVIVLLTFRSVVIPLILVAVIQCAVYTTMSIMNLTGAVIYFIAILVMQAILMGATIDYAILFTSYYREFRRTLDKKAALLLSYKKSVGTILTSAIILTFGTLIVGWFAIEIVSKICLSIAYGTVCATVLILVFAPALISLCDRFVVKKEKGKKDGGGNV